MFHWPPGKTEICNWMEMSPQVWLREGRQCSMGTFWWLMILQPPFPNQEVRWERKTKQRWAPATPRQSGCPWQRRGGLCQFWATSVPGLLWAQKNVRGRFGNLPSAQDEWLSTEHSLRLSLSPVQPPSSTHRGEAENCDKPPFECSLLLLLTIQRVRAVSNIIQSLQSIRYISGYSSFIISLQLGHHIGNNNNVTEVGHHSPTFWLTFH